MCLLSRVVRSIIIVGNGTMSYNLKKTVCYNGRRSGILGLEYYVYGCKRRT